MYRSPREGEGSGLLLFPPLQPLHLQGPAINCLTAQSLWLTSSGTCKLRADGSPALHVATLEFLCGIAAGNRPASELPPPTPSSPPQPLLPTPPALSSQHPCASHLAQSLVLWHFCSSLPTLFISENRVRASNSSTPPPPAVPNLPQGCLVPTAQEKPGNGTLALQSRQRARRRGNGFGAEGLGLHPTLTAAYQPGALISVSCL